MTIIWSSSKILQNKSDSIKYQEIILLYLLKIYMLKPEPSIPPNMIVFGEGLRSDCKSVSQASWRRGPFSLPGNSIICW